MARELDKNRFNYRQQILGSGDITLSAFGQQKVSLDRSEGHHLFTYDISTRGSKEMIWDGSDYIEQTTMTYAQSKKGALSLTSGATLNQRVMLRGLHHVRYQPNRGYLYSVSATFPNPTANGTRRIGAFLPCNGMFIEVDGDGTEYQVYFVIRNHWKETFYNITNAIPEDADISKGNLWDIQMEWRGVGDIKVYFNLQEIFNTKALGTYEYVSIENPSLPVASECINTGDDVEIRIGCIDISMEGGSLEKRFYNSISTGTSLITVSNNIGNGAAVIAIRLPKKIAYGDLVNPATGEPDAGGTNMVCYTRDVVLESISAFAKDESFLTVYAARGAYLSNLPNLSWNSIYDSYVEYTVGGNGTALDTAFQADKANMRLLLSVRHEKDFSYDRTNPAAKAAPFTLTADSYIVIVTIPDGTNVGAGANIELSELI